jgi:hypothetical protein
MYKMTYTLIFVSHIYDSVFEIQVETLDEEEAKKIAKKNLLILNPDIKEQYLEFVEIKKTEKIETIRYKRNLTISNEDIINLKIVLATCKTVTEFINKI